MGGEPEFGAIFAPKIHVIPALSVAFLHPQRQAQLEVLNSLKPWKRAFEGPCTLRSQHPAAVWLVVSALL